MKHLIALFLFVPNLCLAQTGLDDASMVFDGANDRIEVNSLVDDLTGFTDFTFLGKFKTHDTDATGQQILFSAVDDGSAGGQAFNYTHLWIGIRNGQILVSHGVNGSTEMTLGTDVGRGMHSPSPSTMNPC